MYTIFAGKINCLSSFNQVVGHQTQKTKFFYLDFSIFHDFLKNCWLKSFKRGFIRFLSDFPYICHIFHKKLPKKIQYH